MVDATREEVVEVHSKDRYGRSRAYNPVSLWNFFYMSTYPVLLFSLSFTLALYKETQKGIANPGNVVEVGMVILLGILDGMF